MAFATRLNVRARTGPQRPKPNGDENAMHKHLRQASAAGPTRATVKTGGPQRPALGEVTTTAINRRESKASSKNQGKEEVGLKRGRSSSLAAATGPQRVPIAPKATAFNAAAAITSTTTTTARGHVQRPKVLSTARLTIVEQAPVVLEPVVVEEESQSDDDTMDVEEQVEAMVDVEDDFDHSYDEDEELVEEKGKDVLMPRVWPEVGPDTADRYKRRVDEIVEQFDDEVDIFDTTMVSEYAEEIFEYMRKLELETMPSPNYISGQTEITWEMRETLVDWLLQVHLRYHMLPETLWIAVNVVDRFLSKRVVSLVKLQLVGITAMFVAAKYEEILAPSVDEFVFMTNNGYTREEILKGERIVLQTLDFKVSSYCTPYSWMRRISKADDYDIQTRTLSKFLIEVTLLDHRFLRVKPSLVAAIGMYTARRMLGGDWNEAFVFYSGFTEEHLRPGHQYIIEKLAERSFEKTCVAKKYANKKFLKASVFAMDWARVNGFEEDEEDNMMLEQEHYASRPTSAAQRRSVI